MVEIYRDVAAISERHRHRYEVDMGYREVLENQGLVFSGVSPGWRCPKLSKYLSTRISGVQFHPELKSRPFAPHPLFASLIEAALANRALFRGYYGYARTERTSGIKSVMVRSWSSRL